MSQKIQRSSTDLETCEELDGAYDPALHRVAMGTVLATFPLIFMGGLVTSHGAGLAVPDWPNSFGYNMFALPFDRWVGGVFYEHTHRLLGTLAGFCAILLLCQAWGFARNPETRRRIGRAAGMFGGLGAVAAIGTMLAARATPGFPARHLMQGAVALIGVALILGAAWTGRRREPRASVRWLSVGVLGMVIFQGLLGGLRVVLVNLDLAIVHACVAQAFLCLCGAVAVMTGRWWVRENRRMHDGQVKMARVFRLAVVAVAIMYGQLVVGALMRHYQAGLAIPDFPLNYGKLLPPMDQSAMPAIDALRQADGRLNTVTLWQIWLHFGHRVGALLVTGVLAALIVAALRRGRDEPKLARAAWLAALLLVGQIALGILTVLWRKPADIASAHVAVGALLLLTTLVMALRAGRLTGDAARGRAGMPRPLVHDSTIQASPA